ncbi:MAG: glycosyltransferase family 2 protein [Saprospiraceae bacterium]
MSHTTPLVSIITVNYNGKEVTAALLDSLRRFPYPRLEIIVVDNASREDPTDWLMNRYPEIQVIRSEENLGFAGGNNLGVEASTGDFFFFINNDAEVTKGALETLLALFAERPKLGIVSPLLVYENTNLTTQPDTIQYAGTTPVHPLTARNTTLGAMEEDRGQYDEARPTAYAHGASMLMPRSVLEQVGTMFEGFFLYYEELDWCERIRKAGYEIYIEPRAKIIHKESIAVGKMSTLKTYYITRNRILFMRRNKGKLAMFAFTLFLLFATIPKNVLGYLKRGEREHLSVFLRAIWWNYNGEKGTFNATSKRQLQTTN